MRILITGGCGFIGSHLADALVAEGHSITILDNLSTGKKSQAPPQARMVVGDIADAACVNGLTQDSQIVVHLAAVASVDACRDDWLNAHRTNVTGSITVLDAARVRNIPVIYASSAAVYGDNPQLPLTETAEPKPLSNYGLDKLTLEYYAAMAWKNYHLPSVGLRFFNVYGPRQDPHSPYSGVISKFMELAACGEPLTFFGDGEQTRDFIYVSDVVALLTAAIHHTHDGAQVFNGCTGAATSLKQLAATIASVTEKPIRTQHLEERVGDIRHSLGDPEKSSKRIGFKAKKSLHDGLMQSLGATHA